MTYAILPADLPADRDTLTRLLSAYYGTVRPQIAALGVDVPEISSLLDDMWDDIAAFQPPIGQVIVARASDGTPLGCGFLRQCAPGAGELKRLYVVPEARGTGLGRALVEARIAIARSFGWHSLYADTFQGNISMLALYDKLGFTPCGAYEGNGNYPALMPILVFRRLDL